MVTAWLERKAREGGGAVGARGCWLRGARVEVTSWSAVPLLPLSFVSSIAAATSQGENGDTGGGRRWQVVLDGSSGGGAGRAAIEEELGAAGGVRLGWWRTVAAGDGRGRES